MPEVYTQTAPDSQVNAAVQAPEVQTPTESIITRASKVSLDNPQKGNDAPSESIPFNVKDIEKITDPTARKLAEDAYKSFQADYTRKTQELALQRKALEAQASQRKTYKVEDIPQLLQDPTFVQAAQEFQRINGGQQSTTHGGDLTQEEFSYLPPEQQKAYTKMKELEQTNQAILSRLQSSEAARAFEQQDMTLKSKYANYEPAKVDEIYKGMMNGTVQATREHLWKVQDYDSAVERAYQLGREDRKIEMGEKVNASTTTNGVSVVSSGEVPVREANESGASYFRRIAMNNAAKFIKK